MEPGNMDHVGEAARPTTAWSAEIGMAGAVRGSEANIGIGAFDGQLGAASAPPGDFSHFDLSAVAGRRVVPVTTEFHLRHVVPGPGGVAYPNDIGTASWRQLGPIGVVLVGAQLPGGVVPVHGNNGYYSALQPLPGPAGARRGVVPGDMLPSGGGAVYYWDYALQPRPGAGHGEVLVNQLPGGAGHGEVLVNQLPGGAGHGEVLVNQLAGGAGHGEAFVGLLPGGVGAAYDDHAYYALQPCLAAGHGEVLFDLLPDGAGQGEVFVGLLPGGADAGYDDCGYYAWQPRPGAGRGEVLPDGVGMVFDGSGNIARQTLPAPGTRGTDGIAGALRAPNLAEGYDNRGVVAEHLHRLLPFAGIGACSVAVNALAAGPGSAAVAFRLFLLLLGGLFLVTLHVLRL